MATFNEGVKKCETLIQKIRSGIDSLNRKSARDEVDMKILINELHESTPSTNYYNGKATIGKLQNKFEDESQKTEFSNYFGLCKSTEVKIFVQQPKNRLKLITKN